MKHDWVFLLNLFLSIMISIIIVGFVYFFWFDSNPPVVFKNVPFPIDKSVYHPGDPLIATIDYCRNTDVSGVADDSFVDDVVFAIPKKHFSGVPEGCGIIQARLLTIPEHLPPGDYYLMGRNTYRVNVVATRVVEWRTQMFSVSLNP